MVKESFMKEKRIVNLLFLGGAKRVSLAERFSQFAEHLGIGINFFSYELDANVPISLLAKIVVGLRWGDSKIVQHLREVIERWNIHIVLPFVDPAIGVAARLKEKSRDIFIPVSDATLCDIFYDKIQAHRWFLAHGFLTPKEKRHPPFIAKPRYGSASKGIVMIKDKKALAMWDDGGTKEGYLLQEFVDGDEYTVDSYVSSEGKILAVVPRQRIEITAGEVTKTIIVRDREIIRLAKSILAEDNFRGPVTLQFIREKKKGLLYVIEINPRFGGGVIASIEAGVNIPLLLLNDYFHLPQAPIQHWKEGLLMMRAYREIFKYADHY